MTGSSRLQQAAGMRYLLITGTPAAAGAAGVTVLRLELAGSHHAPAAATALLVETGLARPGAPLIGLVLGLALVLVVGSTLTRLPMLCEAPGAGRSVAGTGARR